MLLDMICALEYNLFQEVINMPSDKKRINLTVPDVIYDKLQEYKEENGILNDASACLQLISKQLKAIEEGKIMLEVMRKLSPEQIEQLSKTGAIEMKNVLDQIDK